LKHPHSGNNQLKCDQAIVDGDPPDLPENAYSAAACNFVSGCLNKIPMLRPTYPMLLQHPWLAPLSKPDVITEEDEEDETSEISTAATTPDIDLASPNIDGLKVPDVVVDQEVAEWVVAAIERKRLGKMAKITKPALHAAPLDAVKTPASSEKGLNDKASAEAKAGEVESTG
jgi:mitogen-activated protein kinase kinase